MDHISGKEQGQAVEGTFVTDFFAAAMAFCFECGWREQTGQKGKCMTHTPSETGNPMTEQNQEVETRSGEIQWDAIVKNVHTRVALLRAAWRASETTVAPELHRKMVEDIYLPCLAMLAEFCECFDGADELDAAAASRSADGGTS
jgi:hypothetical protein